METRKELAIVSCCNTNFVPHLAAMFVSILENSPSAAAVHFYVIDDNINFESKQLLYFTIKHTQLNAELTFLKINPHFFKNVVTSERIPKTAYYRIAIPELFRGSQIERLLYMDCDMIALDDVAKLWTVDLGENIIAAVEDAGFHQRLEKMAIPAESMCYFNSGLLLIDVKKWLNLDVTTKVLRFIEENPDKLRFHDQDALNAVLHDRWTLLHPKWNAQGYILSKAKKHPTIYGEKQYEEARRAPSIIHFTGHVKPWTKEFQWYTKRYYDQYANRTAFRCINTFNQYLSYTKISRRIEYAQ